MNSDRFHIGHATTVEYDLCFGLPKRVTDANGRVTAYAHDPFGRVTAATSPDMVTATVRRRRYGTDTTCASVTANGVTVVPAVAVETSSPVAPTTTAYLDELGRVVRTRTQSFSGAHDILEDSLHNARGRVAQRSLPCFDVDDATPHYAAWTHDNLDRVTHETRPDCGKQGHENAFKGPLVDLDLHHPPCRGYRANQAFYAYGQMAHLLLRAVQFRLLPKAARRHGIRPLVRHVMRTVARLVRSGRRLSLLFASCCLRRDWLLHAGLRLRIDSG